MNLLNNHPLTVSEKRNDIAREHDSHPCNKIGVENHKAHSVPWKFAHVQKWQCKKCGVRFDTWNWFEDEDKKIKTTVTHIEK